MSSEDDNLELALVEGITAGFLELVEQLVIGNDVDPAKLNQRVNETGTVLHVTARHGHADILQFLLEHGADVNNSSNFGNATPLHVAVQAGHVEVTKVLLRRGASLNVRMKGMSGGERRGATPLHIAADSGNVDIIQELLNHGAQIDVLDRWNFLTPLVFAVRQGHERAVALLLSRGAAPDGDYRAWSSPLILAASRNYEAIVRLLLDKGADVNRRDEDGDPAIHTAAFCGYENIVRLLLKKGANTIDLIGGSGRPSWWFAAEKGHEKIKSLLEQRFTDQKPKYGNSETQAVQYPPDLIDDSGELFQNYPDGAFVHDVEKAQGFIYSVMDRKESWKERLRFVIPAPADARGEYDIELIEPYRKGETERPHERNEEPDEPSLTAGAPIRSTQTSRFVSRSQARTEAASPFERLSYAQTFSTGVLLSQKPKASAEFGLIKNVSINMTPTTSRPSLESCTTYTIRRTSRWSSSVGTFSLQKTLGDLRISMMPGSLKSCKTAFSEIGGSGALGPRRNTSMQPRPSWYTW